MEGVQIGYTVAEDENIPLLVSKYGAQLEEIFAATLEKYDTSFVTNPAELTLEIWANE